MDGQTDGQRDRIAISISRVRTPRVSVLTRDKNHSNPLECRGNTATSNDIKLVHWPLMSLLLHLIQQAGD